jgi:hypothetical protein
MTNQSTYGRDSLAGPAFGVTLELGEAGDGPRSEIAWKAFWASPLIEGPWFDLALLGDTDRRMDDVCQCAAGGRCYGALRVIGTTESIPFVGYRITDESSIGSQQTSLVKASEWISMDIPVVVLRQFYQIDNSWTLASQPWLTHVCSAFAGVANQVNTKLSIWSGAIGEEISGSWRRPVGHRQALLNQDYPPLAQMSSEVIENRGGVFVPLDLWNELKPKIDPIVLPSGLLYVPPRTDVPLLGA